MGYHQHAVNDAMKFWLQQLLRTPYPTIVGIIALAAVVFLVQELFSLPLAFQYGTVPVEFRHLWHEVLAGRAGIESLGVVVKLFTPLFLHGSGEHLLLNMVFLWTFGTLCAGLLGRWWALGLFLFCGAAGNLAQIGLNPNSPIPIIGASGAVCGFEGVYFGLALRWRLDWPDVWPLARPIPPLQLAAFALIGVAFDIYGLTVNDQPIAYGAHLGGFFSGLIAAGLITLVYRSREDYWRAGSGR